MKEIARTLSHIKCWKIVAQNENISDLDYVLISEAKILLDDDFYELANNYKNTYSNYGIINLSGVPNSSDREINACVYYSMELYTRKGASLYLMRKDVIKSILEKLNTEKPFWLADGFSLFYDHTNIAQATTSLYTIKSNLDQYTALVVYLHGGLGNQLFQYALARKLSIKHNIKILFHTGELSKLKEGHQQFKLDAFLYNNNCCSILTQEASYLLENESITYKQPAFGFCPEVFNLSKYSILCGIWESEKYFEDIRPILLQELTLKKSIRKQVDPWLNYIETSNSVSLHIRRGDFATHGCGMLSIQYYIDALDYLVNKLHNENLDVFVFSNDMAWAKDHLVYDKNNVRFNFFDQSENNYQEEELYLMSRCKHNIIANSTFSWWGAWLNNNPNKIVISPSVWLNFNNPFYKNNKDIIPESWVKIETELV